MPIFQHPIPFLSSNVYVLFSSPATFQFIV
jgi:hypothetical protein